MPPRRGAPPPPPPLPVIYSGPLRAANILARMYVYEWVLRFDPAFPTALHAPLDALHEWDATATRRLLERLVLALAGAPSLATANRAATTEVVDALRRHSANPDANEPWHAAAELIERQPHIALEPLPPVDAPLRGVFAEPEAPPELPRQTRTRARRASAAAAALAKLGESSTSEDDEEAPATRRSRRNEQRAHQRRGDALRAEAAAFAAAAPADDAGEPVALEERIAVLAALCDLVCFAPAVAGRAPLPGAPSVTHALLQPSVDYGADTERAARSAHAKVLRRHEQAERKLQLARPSARSAGYAAWHDEWDALQGAHAAERRDADRVLADELRQVSLRAGPLGYAADGSAYWRLAPCAWRGRWVGGGGGGGADDGDGDAFSGRWAEYVLQLAPGHDEVRGTAESAAVAAHAAGARDAGLRSALQQAAAQMTDF